MSKSKLRLAFRIEGNFWNAYLAMPDSMANATLIGSILMGAVLDKERKSRFISLMQDSVSAAAADLNLPLSWSNPPVPAPEHERGGNA